MKYFFETYGCQMNSAESAALVLACRERGWEEAPDGESADLVLINTCSVRATAEQRALGRIALYASLKKKRLEKGQNFALVIAGCMAQRMGDDLQEKYPAVDYLMGTAGRSLFPLILEAVEKNIDDGNFPEIKPDEEPQFSFSPSHLEEAENQSPVRSFVPIMHGCNNYCSYCIVPYLRGREVSRDPEFILEEIRQVGQRGVKEITLLGQNVNSYNWNKGEVKFARLLQKAGEEAEKSGVKWIRFLSVNPANFSQETIAVMAENKVFCRHLHLCVQHGSNRILAKMNRGYNREYYLKLIADIRRVMPDISFSTDILVGFPGEKEEDFAEILTLMEEVKFLYAYMYHFNPREGTAAYKFTGRISEEIKRERLNKVINLQKEHTAALLQKRLGQKEKVLIEGVSRKNAGELIGRTERDEMVVVPGDISMIGSFANVTLSTLKGHTLWAKEFIQEEL